MQTGWLDSTLLKNHSFTRDSLPQNASNDDKTEFVWRCMVLLTSTSLGVCGISTNIGGAKKMFLIKREVPAADLQEVVFDKILNAMNVQPHGYAAVSMDVLNANPPTNAPALPLQPLTEDAGITAIAAWHTWA